MQQNDLMRLECPDIEASLDVYKYISPAATRAICDALVKEAEHAAALSGEIADSRRHGPGSQRTRIYGAAKQDSESSFASLATTFVNALAFGSPSDLGKDWLLHRLHCIFVEHQPLKPGEVEVLRADIRARAKKANFSETETDLLTSGVEKALNWVMKRPVREIGLSPPEAKEVGR